MSELLQAMQEASQAIDKKKANERKVTIPKRQEVQSSPTLILAYGLALAVVIVAFGYSMRWVIPALGAGFGIGASIVQNGIGGIGGYSSWVVQAGAVGLVTGAVVALIFLVLKIVKSASHEIYLWLLPVLALLAGLCVDLCKDFYPNLPLMRIIFGAETIAVFVLGGLWWKRYGLLNKIAGTILVLTSPLFIFVHKLSDRIDQGFFLALDGLSTQTWAALSGMVFLIIVMGVLASTLGDELND